LLYVYQQTTNNASLFIFRSSHAPEFEFALFCFDGGCDQNQTQAAKVFAVTQPRISNLMRGKINLFSIDLLVAMLSSAGVEVEMKIIPVKSAAIKRAGKGRDRMSQGTARSTQQRPAA